MAFELLFLGTGTSAGVPMIGCNCHVCQSEDPRDRRSRASVLVRYPDAQDPSDTAEPRALLIDTTPELRLQAVQHRLHRLDGVLYTHGHADHVLGLDDLRRFNAVMKAPLDVYAESPVLQQFQRMFPYVFEPHRNVNPSFVATLVPHELEAGCAVDLFGARWTPLRLMHGRLPILGFRVDWNGQSLAYCTDVSTIPPQTYPHLEGLDVLVIDALRYRHHPTHMTVDQALEVIEQVRPVRSYLTHIAHDICHAELEARLPEHIRIAYDGLSVSLADIQGA